MKALLAAAAATALLTTGCAGSSAAADISDTAVTDIQTSVDEAIAAAKSYGQQHLGHYLELDRKAMRTAGVTPADGVVLTVFVDHVDVCISATTTALPAGTEWSTATATTDKPEAVAGGRCSSDALKTFRLGG